MGITNLLSEEAKGDVFIRVYDIEPNKYREINQMCKQNSGVTVEVLVNVIINEETKEIEKSQFSSLEPLVNKKREEEEEQKV